MKFSFIPTPELKEVELSPGMVRLIANIVKEIDSAEKQSFRLDYINKRGITEALREDCGLSNTEAVLFLKQNWDRFQYLSTF